MNLLEGASSGNAGKNVETQRNALIESASSIFDRSYADKYTHLGSLFESEDRGKQYRGALTVHALEQTKSALASSKSSLSEATVQSSLGPLNTRVYDVVRMFYPNLIAHEITDIQPLNGQVGSVFTMRPVFDDVTGENNEPFVDVQPDGYTSRVNEAGNHARLETTITNTSSVSGTAIGSPTRLQPSVDADAYKRGTDFLPIKPGSVQLTLSVGTLSSSQRPLVLNDRDANGILHEQSAGTGTLDTLTPNTFNFIDYASGRFTVNIAALTADDDVSVQLDFESAGSREIDSEIAEQEDRFDQGSLPRQLSFRLINTPVKARVYPVTVNYSIPGGLAAEQHLAINVGDTVTEMAAQYIKTERDERLIRKILAAAPVATSGDALAKADARFADWSAANPMHYSLAAKYNEFADVIDSAEAYIQTVNGRGGVDWIVCGRNVGNVVRNIRGFRSSGTRAPIGPYVDGTLRDGTVTVIRINNTGLMDPNHYIVGFKGYQAGEAAVILAEWIPLYVTAAWEAPTLEVSRGLATAYEMLVNNAKYFVHGAISDYGSGSS